jgi:hypothetical protein
MVFFPEARIFSDKIKNLLIISRHLNEISW